MICTQLLQKAVLRCLVVESVHTEVSPVSLPCLALCHSFKALSNNNHERLQGASEIQQSALKMEEEKTCLVRQLIRLIISHVSFILFLDGEQRDDIDFYSRKSHSSVRETRSSQTLLVTEGKEG